MRIKAKVKVSHRGLSQFNMKAPGKASFSSLALGKKTVKENETEEVFLMHCTQSNRAGTKYNVIGNVEKLFCNFASEGKATIRLKEPQHDLCISECDPIELKALLTVLTKVLRGDREEMKKLGMSALQPASRSQLTAPVKSMLIEDKKDYPLKTNFPKTLEKLSVVSIKFKKMDERIFKLKHLTRLTFADAGLQKIPEQLGLLDNLQHIDFTGNAVESVPPSLFRYGGLRKTLNVLILSRNRISKLPEEIGLLESLHILEVTDNLLKRLPLSIEKAMVRSQETLIDVTRNPIKTLPVSLSNCRMNHLKCSDSPALFRACKEETVYNTFNDLPPPLVDQCLVHLEKRYGKRTRRVLHPSEVPQGILDLYESRLKCCACGRWTFSAREVRIVPFNLKRLSQLGIVFGNAHEPMVVGEAVVGPCGHSSIPSFL